jgi:hypothetical protein
MLHRGEKAKRDPCTFPLIVAASRVGVKARQPGGEDVLGLVDGGGLQNRGVGGAGLQGRGVGWEGKTISGII